MTRLIWFLALIGIVGVPAPAGAIDVVGDPPDYLELNLRPRWRLADLGKVLDEIAELIEKPVSRTLDVTVDDPLIVLIEENNITVREALELLERSQDLHFRAEPLRLTVQTGTEWRRWQRRLVNLNLRDYGLFFRARDSLQSPVGHVGSEIHDSGTSPFGFSESDDEDVDLSDFDDLFEQAEVDRGDAEARGHGNLMVRVTEAEETALRRELEVVTGLRQRRSDWRLHFGYAPEASEIDGGVVPVAELRQLADDLDGAVVLEMSAQSGQRVTASVTDSEATFIDGELNQTGRMPVLTPVISNLVIGKSASLRPIQGLEHTLIAFDIRWCESHGKRRRQKVRRPASVESGVVDGKIGPATVHPGLQFEIEQQGLWVWLAEGEVFLPRNHGLVLVASHDGRRAVVLIEEVR